MDRSILQDFEREDDGCVLNSYPSAWVLNRTGGDLVAGATVSFVGDAPNPLAGRRL